MAKSTDHDWERWGRTDPYFAVRTEARFRKAQLSAQSVTEFFASGEEHVAHVMTVIRRYLAPDFRPARALDFGCGTGRVTIPLAAHAEAVVGMDVSESMLKEAQRNVAERGIGNVVLAVSDDALSHLSGAFDLIHSFIVFQHIPEARGVAIFQKLLTHLAPGGIAAVQVLYSKAHYAASNGLPPQMTLRGHLSRLKTTILAAFTPTPAEPEMQMNTYDLNRLYFLLHEAGIRELHVELTDHGGEYGAFVFFRKP